MGTEDQLSMDLGVPVEQTPWGKWVDPDRQAAQVRTFLDRAGVKSLPTQPWLKDAPELKKLDAVVTELFPDMDTAMAAENADIADAFICFLGAYAIRFAGARWYEAKWFGREYSFYDDINPALAFGDHDESEFTVWGLMDGIAGQDFSGTADMIREMAAEYAGKRG